MKQLTDRQAEILSFVKLFIANVGYPPSNQEIADNFGFKSPNAAYEAMRAIQKKGAVHIKPRISRGIVVLA